MGKAGINGANVKQKNRGLTLRLIACGEADSRVALTRKTGLTKMTVSNIISAFLEAGYLVETEIQRNEKRGCNPVRLALAESAPKALALALTRDKAAAVLVDLSGRMRGETAVVPLERETPETLRRKLISAAETALGQTRERILGIGVASIGPVHAGKGVLLNPVNFFGISNFDIKGVLEQAFGLPAVVNNDMNAAALAERLYGAGRAYENFVYLGIANGIGAGVVANGALYYNPSGFSGEVGHMSIQADGRPCFCGNRGCLETYASIPVITAALRQACGLACAPNPQAFPYLYQNPAGRAVFDQMEEKLTAALVNLANLFSPPAILVGHDGFYLPEEMLQRMEEQLNRRVLFAGCQEVRLLRSAFRDQALLLGAACCVFQRVFDGTWALDETEEKM